MLFSRRRWLLEAHCHLGGRFTTLMFFMLNPSVVSGLG
jgi:hypothetical protein